MKHGKYLKGLRKRTSTRQKAIEKGYIILYTAEYEPCSELLVYWNASKRYITQFGKMLKHRPPFSYYTKFKKTQRNLRDRAIQRRKK